MSLLFALRVFGDLNLYFALAGAIGGICGQTMNLWIPALICAAAAGFARWLQEKPIRILPLLLLVGCFFLPQSLADWMILIPPLFYVFLLTITHRFALNQGEYADFFPKGLLAALLVCVFSLVGLDLAQAVRHSAAYLLCGVYLMRQLRLQKGSDWLHRLINLLVLAAVLGLGFLFSYGIRSLSALSVVLMGFLRWVSALLEKFARSITVSDAPPPPPLNTSADHAGSGGGGFAFDNSIVRQDFTDVVKVIVIVLLFAAAAWGIFKLVRSMLGSFGKDEKTARQPVWTERLSREKQKRDRLGHSNRERIRRIYQRFLKFLRSKGAELHPSQTTAEIHLQALGWTERRPAAELRDLYRTARYDPKAEITAEQVRKAKELLREMD